MFFWNPLAFSMILTDAGNLEHPDSLDRKVVDCTGLQTCCYQRTACQEHKLTPAGVACTGRELPLNSVEMLHCHIMVLMVMVLRKGRH